MNPLLRILAAGALVLLAAIPSNAASAFEGKLVQRITDEKGRSHDLNYSTKGTKVRMDIAAEKRNAAMIMDLEKLEMLMLMPEEKMYMVMPLKKPVEKAIEKASDTNVDVQVTGKTETILGYTCNQVLITDKKTKAVTETWLAEGLGVFMGLGQNGGGPFGGRKASAAAWEEALKGKAGYPLRVIGHDAKGKETFKMETIQIEPGSLPDSLFVPPKDFQKFQMPNIGDMFNRGG